MMYRINLFVKVFPYITGYAGVKSGPSFVGLPGDTPALTFRADTPVHLLALSYASQHVVKIGELTYDCVAIRMALAAGHIPCEILNAEMAALLGIYPAKDDE